MYCLYIRLALVSFSLCLWGRNCGFAKYRGKLSHIIAQTWNLCNSGVFTIQVASWHCDRRGSEGRPGIAFYRGALKDSKFPSELSRVRGLPVARLLSGSNHILKGFLTRNTSMKKYIAPVPLGGTVFRGGSGCFMFEDLNTSKESGELTSGSFSGHFGTMSILCTT